jgi:RHS repeat-associated protein
VIEYTYDGLRRLSNEKHIAESGGAETESAEIGGKNDVWERHYQYDGNDNLVSEHSNATSGNTERIEYFYNTIDQLTNLKLNGNHSSIPVIYDANGRLIQDHKGKGYAYDDAGYLLNVSTTGGEDTAFQYWPNGVLGHAFTKQAHSDYYPDQHHSIQTVYKDRQWHSFIRQDSGIIGVKADQSMGQGFTVNQSMGAYLQLQGSGDTSLEGQHYDAYGKILDKNKNHRPVLNAFGWNQELNNPELGLTYLRHRFYSPELRRFVSRDSLDVDNRYAYVYANPVNYIDPTGHNAVVNYTLGSIFTSLGILGAALAVPTGGASLTLSSAAGIGAGVTSALSGMSLLGSQMALDAGNKTVAKALSSSSIALSVLAIGQVVVSLAPTITNAFVQASRFFSSSSVAASSGATAEAAETASLSASGEAAAKLNPAVALANTEAVVSGWSIAATVTENTVDLTTDIFADHAVGISMDRIGYGRMMNLGPMESTFPDNGIPNPHVWLTRIRGWLFKHLSAEDVEHYIGRCKIETVFSEDELLMIAKPNVLDAFKRFGMQSESTKTGFSYYKVPSVN